MFDGACLSVLCRNFLVFFFLVLPDFVSASTPHQDGVPFKIVGGNIIVEAKVNGAGPFNFIVDSGGGGAHSVSSLIVAQIPLKRGRRGTGYSFSGKIGLRKHGEVSIELANGHKHVGKMNSWLKPYDDQKTIDKTNNLPQGVLGSPLFSNYIVEFDFANNRLFVDQPKDWKAPSSAQKLKVNMGKASQIARTEITVNGLVGQFYLDTGAYAAFAVKKAFHKASNMRSLDFDVELYSSSENTHAKAVSADSIKFGGYIFNNVEGLVLEKERLRTDGVIGLGLLGCFRIWYAYANSEVWIGEQQSSELCHLSLKNNNDKLLH